MVANRTVQRRAESLRRQAREARDRDRVAKQQEKRERRDARRHDAGIDAMLAAEV